MHVPRDRQGERERGREGERERRREGEKEREGERGRELPLNKHPLLAKVRKESEKEKEYIQKSTARVHIQKNRQADACSMHVVCKCICI